MPLTLILLKEYVLLFRWSCRQKWRQSYERNLVLKRQNLTENLRVWVTKIYVILSFVIIVTQYNFFRRNFFYKIAPCSGMGEILGSFIFTFIWQCFPTGVRRHIRVQWAGTRGAANKFNSFIFIPSWPFRAAAKYLHNLVRVPRTKKGWEPLVWEMNDDPFFPLPNIYLACLIFLLM